MAPVPITVDLTFRQHVATLLEGVVNRAETMACKVEREQVKSVDTSGKNINAELLQALQGAPVNTPVISTVVNLISSAMNPVQLTKMGDMYIPWF